MATYSNSISVKWDASNKDGGSPITGYMVEYYITSNHVPELKTQSVGSNIFSVTLDGLAPSTKYDVWVRAVNSEGHSVPSTTVQIQTDPDGGFIE